MNPKQQRILLPCFIPYRLRQQSMDLIPVFRLKPHFLRCGSVNSASSASYDPSTSATNHPQWHVNLPERCRMTLPPPRTAPPDPKLVRTRGPPSAVPPRHPSPPPAPDNRHVVGHQESQRFSVRGKVVARETPRSSLESESAAPPPSAGIVANCVMLYSPNPWSLPFRYAIDFPSGDQPGSYPALQKSQPARHRTRFRLHHENVGRRDPVPVRRLIRRESNPLRRRADQTDHLVQIGRRNNSNFLVSISNRCIRVRFAHSNIPSHPA